MLKSERIYKVLMTTMIAVIIGLLLATGIIAIQKSMKLNLSFNVQPTFLFEIYVEKDSQKEYVFRNFEADGKPLKFGDGLESLQGNKLTANNDFLKDYGDTFSIVIANYSTDKDLKVTMTSTATTSEGNGTPAEIEEVENSALRLVENSTANEAKFNITIPTAVFTQETYLEMQFEEFVYYTVSFNGNGNTSGSMSDENVEVNEDFRLPTNTFVREGYEFIGWTITADGAGTVYTDTQSIQNLVAAGGSVELFAKWREIVYYVSFNGNENTSGTMATQSVKYGTACQLPANQFEKTEYVFNGWNTKADGTGTAYADKSQITTMPGQYQTITLYAQWKLQTYTLTLSVAWDAPNYGYDDVVVFVTNDDSFYMNDEGYGNDHDHYVGEYSYLSEDIEYFQKDGYEYKIYEDISQSMTIPVGYYVWVYYSGYEVTYDIKWLFYETTITGYNYVQYVIKKGLPYGVFRMPSNALNLTLQMYMFIDYNGETWG